MASCKKIPQELIGQRYGNKSTVSEAVEEGTISAATSQTIEQQIKHRTVRKFLSAEVSDEVLNALVIAAQSAATSSNLQVWSVVAIRNPETIVQIARISTQDHVRAAKAVLIWLVDETRAHFIAQQASQRAAITNYLDPVFTAVCDVGIASQNAVVAAESLGLGTVYLGSIRNDVDKITELLDLPGHVFPVVGLSVGYPDPAEQAGIKPRLPLRTVLHQEKYDNTGFSEDLSAYEEASAEYYRRFNLQESWSERVLARVSDGSPARNHAYIKNWLKEHGFGLA